jgi:hypothetical protein
MWKVFRFLSDVCAARVWLRGDGGLVKHLETFYFILFKCFVLIKSFFVLFSSTRISHFSSCQN